MCGSMESLKFNLVNWTNPNIGRPFDSFSILLITGGTLIL